VFLIGFAAVFALFQWLGWLFASDRGQAGLMITVAVVAAILSVEMGLTGRSLRESARWLGFGTPAWSGLVALMVVCLLQLLVVPIHFAMTRNAYAMYPGWIGLLPGLFAQAGIAEETLFRGYLFRHVRQGRAFWPAAFVSSGPFVLVHLWLFATMPWAIALASVLLSAVLSFPLARLFELGGNAIWTPAILHWIVQAVPKVLVPGEAPADFALVWIVSSAIIPFVAFLVRQPAFDALKQERTPL
jgi:membrane protease YdiL (CAAX protease family)